MKHNLFAFAMLLAALFAGCSDSETGNTTPPEPTPDELFTITVQNIKAVMAEVSVDPKNPKMTYYTDVLNDADFQQAMERGFDDYLQWYIAKLMTDYSLSYNAVIEMITSLGHEDYTLTTLRPESLYHAVAVGIDADGYVTTEVVSKAFTTDKAVVSENRFEVQIAQESHFGAAITVTPSNDDSYLVSVEPAIMLEGKTDEEIASEIISGGLAWGGIEELLHTGPYAWEEQECKPGWDYEVVIFGYESGLPTTPVQRIPFSTLEAGDAAACTFEMTAEFAPFDTHITITPSDRTVVYIADVIEEEYLQTLIAEFGSEERAMAENVAAMIDFYAGELGSRAASVDLITTTGRVAYDMTHKPECEYRIWAAVVDQHGELRAPVCVGEKFRTPEEQIADAHLTLKGWTCYDGDELYKVDKEAFAGAKGFAVLYAEVEPSESAAEWYYYAAYGDLTDYSCKTLINNLLIAPTEKNLTEQWIVCYWGVNTIWGMALDAEGHYGETFTQVVELSKETATPVPDNLSSRPQHRAPQVDRRGFLIAR